MWSEKWIWCQSATDIIQTCFQVCRHILFIYFYLLIYLFIYFIFVHKMEQIHTCSLKVYLHKHRIWFEVLRFSVLVFVRMVYRETTFDTGLYIKLNNQPRTFPHGHLFHLTMAHSAWMFQSVRHPLETY